MLDRDARRAQRRRPARAAARRRRRRAASSVIWLPICMSTPATRMPGSVGGAGIERGRLGERHAELVLGLAGRDLVVGLGVDVGIDAQRDGRGLAPRGGDLAESSSSSGSDFDVEAAKMPASSAKAISRAVLPTPENTILRPGMPAASARRSSPSETTSMPAPSLASVSSTAWLDWPSCDSRRARRRRRTPRRTRGSGARASPSNSNRTACRPRRRCSARSRPRRGARLASW